MINLNNVTTPLALNGGGPALPRSGRRRQPRKRNANKQNKRTNQTRNGRKNQAKQIVRSTVAQLTKLRAPRTLLGKLGITDQKAISGTSKMLDTLFVGDTGISRSIAFGSDQTALCKYKGTFDYSLLAGGQVNLTICPAGVASTNWMSANSGLASAFITAGNPTNPFTSGAGITGSSISGPFFATNPSTGWRIVRTAVKITPTANLLNQGGYINACHMPIMYTGVAGAGPGYAGPSTFSDFMNIPMQRKFTGTTPIVYQWFPNQQEIYTVATSTYAATVSSGWSGASFVIMAPASGAMSVTIDYEVGIEYVPNSSYRPFVDSSLPDMHPDAIYFMNQFVSKHWVPAVFGTNAEYQAEKRALDPVGHEHTDSIAHRMDIGFDQDYAKLPLDLEGDFLNKGFDLFGENVDPQTWLGSDPYSVITNKVKGGISAAAMGLLTAALKRETNQAPLYK